MLGNVWGHTGSLSAIRIALRTLDALPLRSRVLVFVLALGSVYFLWEQALFGPLDRERKRMGAELERLAQERGALDQQLTVAAGAAPVDPNRVPRLRFQTLEARVAAANQRLAGLTSHLVPPREMPKVLEAVLNGQGELRLLALEGVKAAPLVEPKLEPVTEVKPKSASQLARELASQLASASAVEAEPEPAPEAQPLDSALYRHGLRLVLEGGYLQTLSYLKALEDLGWGFLWDEVDLEVVSYPTTRVSITVYSLSLEEGWLGI